MSTINYTGILETYRCANCYMTVAIPTAFIEDRRRDHDTFYCPAGHKNYFPHESDLERLKRELEAKNNELCASENNVAFYIESLEEQKRKTAAQKGQKMKILNRIEKGVCPHCNRYFVNLHKHMDSKHKTKAKK